MKRIAVIALMVLCLAGCAKNNLLDLSGSWETSTKDGALYLNLGKSSGTAHFSGYETSSVSYTAKDDWTATFYGSVYTKDYKRYKFGGAFLNTDGILKISTEIPADKKTTTLSFHKK